MCCLSNLFFNTAIISNQSSWLGSAANAFLSPSRYLFHGRTVEVWNQIVVQADHEPQPRNWVKTAAAILFLVPGILLGMVAKLLDYALFDSTRADCVAVETFDQNPCSLQENISLNLSHARLDKMATSLKDRMTSKEVWTNPAFIAEVSSFMEAAYQEIEMFYEHLEERYDKDSSQIARAMAQDQLCDVDGKEDKTGQFYFYFYFYNSLTEIYHLARSCTYLENHAIQKGAKIVHFSSLTDEDQVPYFTPDTPQYHWRMLYNQFCNKLDEIDGLREKLTKEDARFINWSKPDDEIVNEYLFPHTRPTPIFFN